MALIKRGEYEIYIDDLSIDRVLFRDRRNEPQVVKYLQSDENGFSYFKHIEQTYYIRTKDGTVMSPIEGTYRLFGGVLINVLNYEESSIVFEPKVMLAKGFILRG